MISVAYPSSLTFTKTRLPVFPISRLAVALKMHGGSPGIFFLLHDNTLLFLALTQTIMVGELTWTTNKLPFVI
jgi:hypothetical protein